MGRLRVLSGREVCAILERHGFAEVRRRGSHVVMQRRTETFQVLDEGEYEDRDWRDDLRVVLEEGAHYVETKP